MAHGSKKWIRDWRGRLKRSRHRTQQDWKGELATSATVRRRIGYDRKCPQCTYLKKRAQVMCWTVRIDLCTIDVAPGYTWYDDHAYRKLREAGIRPQAERHVVANFSGRRTRWTLYHHVRVYDRRRLAEYPPDSDVREVRWQVGDCEPCRRKEDVSWRLWHGGGELRKSGQVIGGRCTGVRRQELRDRRNEARNLIRRAKYDPELYDLLPRKYKNDWLD